MRDELGNRMKSYYEDRTRISLPRRTYTIIRIDGKAFHTYTRGLDKPFDLGLISDMDETAMNLCSNIQGAKFAFVQSDEISILLTDFDKIKTDAWFDGNIQKMASISASIATAKFNQLRMMRYIREKFDCGVRNITYRWMELFEEQKLAQFDARVFTIPSKTEVMNYFVWRQQDTVRNSISSAAQSQFSHNELNGKTTSDMQEMLFQKGINWNDYLPKLKRGRFIQKVEFEFVPDVNRAENMPPADCFQTVTRNRWESADCPIFTQDQEFLNERIPNL